mgnify:CR=1
MDRCLCDVVAGYRASEGECVRLVVPSNGGPGPKALTSMFSLAGR